MTEPAQATGEHPLARTLTRARRLGYRYLPGDLFSFIMHLRPRHWLTMAMHVATGYALATRFPLDIERPGTFALGLFTWVVFGSSGTLAVNTAFDRDTGDVGYIAAPPRAPAGLAAFALVWLSAGLVVAIIALPRAFVALYALCFALALMYSVPPIRLKRVPGADWLVNITGYGALTPLAGWSLSGESPEPWALLVILAFAVLFGALYPLTQFYQREEDATRGDRTLALVLGVRRCLRLAALNAVLAFVCFLLACRLRPGLEAWPLLVLPAWLWFRVLYRWLGDAEAMGRRDHALLMYRAGGAWFWTGPSVVAALSWLAR